MFVGIGLCLVFKHSPFVHEIVHYRGGGRRGGLCSLLHSFLWEILDCIYMMHVVLGGIIESFIHLLET